MSPPAVMAEQKPKRRRANAFAAPRPTCPEHGDTMYANGTAARWTNYYCAAEGCKHSQKRPHVSIDGKQGNREAS